MSFSPKNFRKCFFSHAFEHDIAVIRDGRFEAPRHVGRDGLRAEEIDPQRDGFSPVVRHWSPESGFRSGVTCECLLLPVFLCVRFEDVLPEGLEVFVLVSLVEFVLFSGCSAVGLLQTRRSRLMEV